jgi:hypothetical protein
MEFNFLWHVKKIEIGFIHSCIHAFKEPMNTLLTYPFAFLQNPFVYNSLTYTCVAGRFIYDVFNQTKYMCALSFGYFAIFSKQSEFKIAMDDSKTEIILAEQPVITKILIGSIFGYTLGPTLCFCSMMHSFYGICPFIRKLMDPFIVLKIQDDKSAKPEKPANQNSEKEKDEDEKDDENINEDEDEEDEDTKNDR